MLTVRPSPGPALAIAKIARLADLMAAHRGRPNLARWSAATEARPAVQRGIAATTALAA
jgi:hypothetical protein